MECYYRSVPTKRGYRKRMLALLEQLGEFETTEQRLADQARHIRVYGWISELDMEAIKSKIEEPITTPQETHAQPSEGQSTTPALEEIPEATIPDRNVDDWEIYNLKRLSPRTSY